MNYLFIFSLSLIFYLALVSRTAVGQSNSGSGMCKPKVYTPEMPFNLFVQDALKYIGTSTYGNKSCGTCSFRGYFDRPLFFIFNVEGNLSNLLPPSTPLTPTPTPSKPGDRYRTLEEAITIYETNINKEYMEVNLTYDHSIRAVEKALVSEMELIMNLTCDQGTWEKDLVRQTSRSITTTGYISSAYNCMGGLTRIFQDSGHHCQLRSRYYNTTVTLQMTKDTFTYYYQECRLNSTIKRALNTSCHLLKDRAKEQFCDPFTDPVLICAQQLRTQRVELTQKMERVTYQFQEFCEFTSDNIRYDIEICKKKFNTCLKESVQKYHKALPLGD